MNLATARFELKIIYKNVFQLIVLIAKYSITTCRKLAIVTLSPR